MGKATLPGVQAETHTRLLKEPGKRMKRLARIVLPLLALAACGETDEEKIRSVAELWAETDPAVCDSLSRDFIDGLFRAGLKDCREVTAKDKDIHKIAFKNVSINGDKSTVTADYAGIPVKAGFIKQGDDWKMDSFRFVAKNETKAPPQSRVEPKIREGLGARATVDAYYQAVDDEDPAALCGLLSRRHAIRVLGGDKRATPIADCVEELQAYDWSKTRKKGAGVKAVEVIRSGERATVTVSSGKRALLTKDKGRWVVDDIKP